MRKKWIVGLLGVLVPLVGLGFWAMLPDPPPYASLDNAQLEEKAARGALIVDIRRPDEWRETGVIAGSHLITAFDDSGRLRGDFPARFSALAGPDDEVVIICRTGNRTDVLGRMLAEQVGYSNVHNVTRGISQWIREGGPVERCTTRGGSAIC